MINLPHNEFPKPFIENKTLPKRNVPPFYEETFGKYIQKIAIPLKLNTYKFVIRDDKLKSEKD